MCFLRLKKKKTIPEKEETHVAEDKVMDFTLRMTSQKTTGSNERGSTVESSMNGKTKSIRLSMTGTPLNLPDEDLGTSYSSQVDNITVTSSLPPPTGLVSQKIDPQASSHLILASKEPIKPITKSIRLSAILSTDTPKIVKEALTEEGNLVIVNTNAITGTGRIVI